MSDQLHHCAKGPETCAECCRVYDLVTDLTIRAEKAERERDEALAAAERARADWHPTSIRAAWDRMETLKARVLALAEEWEATRSNIDYTEWAYQDCARALREAVEGGGK